MRILNFITDGGFILLQRNFISLKIRCRSFFFFLKRLPKASLLTITLLRFMGHTDGWVTGLKQDIYRKFEATGDGHEKKKREKTGVVIWASTGSVWLKGRAQTLYPGYFGLWVAAVPAQCWLSWLRAFICCWHRSLWHCSLSEGQSPNMYMTARVWACLLIGNQRLFSTLFSEWSICFSRTWGGQACTRTYAIYAQMYIHVCALNKKI